MLAAHAERDRVLDLEPVIDVGTVLAAQAAVAAVHGAEPLRRYIVALCERTRSDSRVQLGASPRAGLLLFRAAKARAALQGRDHALPDDVQELAPLGARPQAAARTRSRAARGRRGGSRRRGADPGAVGRPMTAARATLLLGLALVLGGVLFDVPTLYVPGIALALIAVDRAALDRRLRPRHGPALPPRRLEHRRGRPLAAPGRAPRRPPAPAGGAHSSTRCSPPRRLSVGWGATTSSRSPCGSRTGGAGSWAASR